MSGVEVASLQSSNLEGNKSITIDENQKVSCASPQAEKADNSPEKNGKKSPTSEEERAPPAPTRNPWAKIKSQDQGIGI